MFENFCLEFSQMTERRKKNSHTSKNTMCTAKEKQNTHRWNQKAKSKNNSYRQFKPKKNWKHVYFSKVMFALVKTCLRIKYNTLGTAATAAAATAAPTTTTTTNKKVKSSKTVWISTGIFLDCVRVNLHAQRSLGAVSLRFLLFNIPN